MPEHKKVISIQGAREHNLKNVSLELPRDRLIVFTGLSGSGKSSLAFDTIYAEGQRRYVESLSAYARQFLEMMQKRVPCRIDRAQSTTRRMTWVSAYHGQRQLHAASVALQGYPVLALATGL